MQNIIVLLIIIAVAVGIYIYGGHKEAQLMNKRRNLRRNGHYSTEDNDHLIF